MCVSKLCESGVHRSANPITFYSHDIRGDTAYDPHNRFRSRCFEDWPVIQFPFPVSEPTSQSTA
ncbi:hypothetical protein DL93DRAFT_2080579 [Clavulina sp. PMI_390]|nr:hypothetical protein DL93DRAFT_2080579 [Clavulina sp. PMI_390]